MPTTKQGSFRILNWNIGGAKYLESRSGDVNDDESREYYRDNLNRQLKQLLTKEENRPDVVTLQEVVEYRQGERDVNHRIIDDIPGYRCFFKSLIDTDRHSHQGKWRKTRLKGEWHCPGEHKFACADEAANAPCKGKKEHCKRVYFAQGNAVLIRSDLPRYPVWELPLVAEVRERHEEGRRQDSPVTDSSCIEDVPLESGLYFGDRNTEPRAAHVTHVVLHQLVDAHRKPVGLSKPLDIFIVNLHLTTLMNEREGVPDIDEEASKTRIRQLNIVLNDIMSRYNLWRKSNYRIRGTDDLNEKDLRNDPRHDRHNPIWIVAGDFNCTPESLEYQTLVRRGLIDMMPLIDNNHQLTKSRGVGGPATIALDYVFAGPKFEAIDPRVERKSLVLDTMVSDHKPLQVTLPLVVE